MFHHRLQIHVLAMKQKTVRVGENDTWTIQNSFENVEIVVHLKFGKLCMKEKRLTKCSRNTHNQYQYEPRMQMPIIAGRVNIQSFWRICIIIKFSAKILAPLNWGNRPNAIILSSLSTKIQSIRSREFCIYLSWFKERTWLYITKLQKYRIKTTYRFPI